MSALMRIDPFRGLRRLEREMDRWFGGFFEEPLAHLHGHQDLIRIPTLDLRETEEELILTAEMPGVSKENIEVEVTPETLRLTGQVREERGEKEVICHRCERVYGRFERMIPLPTEVMADKVKATLEDGVLEIHLPKTEHAKAETPRKITVE